MDEHGRLVARAREAIRLADGEPRRAAQLADEVLFAAELERDFVAASMAERARGRAAFLLEDPGSAVKHLRRAIALGRRAQSPVAMGEARMTLAFVQNWRGKTANALAQINASIDELAGVERARARAQRGAIMHQQGRLDEAVTDYRAALPILRRAGDGLWVQRVLSNRGVAHTDRREFTAARNDLTEARRICAELDLPFLVAVTDQNLGTVEAYRGDLPAALENYDRAEQQLRTLGAHLGPVLVDRSELLLSARLLHEARDAAELAVRSYESEDRVLQLPEARLLLARVAQVEGDADQALKHTALAIAEFSRLRLPDWVALSRLMYMTIRAVRDGRAPANPASLVTATRNARNLRPDVVLESWIATANACAQMGRVTEARRRWIKASAERHTGPATLRARRWYAEALLRRSLGDQRGASRAARQGLSILDDYAAVIGATDVRAHLASHRLDLAELGLRAAVAAGSAWNSFVWADLGRTRNVHHEMARPVRDAKVADALAELRIVTHALDEARSSKRPSTSLAQRQVALERQVRDHHRRQRASGSTVLRLPRRRPLAEALGDAAVVEYIVLDGDLRAITLVNGRTRMRTLGRLAAATALAERLPFALHRMVRTHAAAASREAAEDLLLSAADQLDQVMLRPLSELVGHPLVIVPSASLQWLPWSVLPSCVGRPITVSPSVAAWYAAARHLPTSTKVVVVGGPGLPGARHEADTVAALHGVSACVAEHATVERVSSLMAGASLVHLAAHGRVRADNPQFGSLAMTDGPLMIHDLEALGHMPHTVVVAACDAGRPVVPVGNELLGLTASLLRQGSGQLVASVLPILDLKTEPLMLDLHRRLARGERLADALARAQQTLRADGAEGLATAAGFLCFGAGFTAPLPRG